MVLSAMSSTWLRAAIFSMGCAIAAGLPVVSAVWASDGTSSGAESGAESGAGIEQRELNPANLVREMSMALKMLNYEGRFVHVQGSNITSMHIIHASDSKGELERMSSLDGEAREVIRNNSLVTCIWPGTQSVVVSKSKPRDLLPKLDGKLTTGNRYTFAFGKPDRVAGRLTHVVNVMPMDQYRYGYRFWIDQSTKMLLRSMLLEGRDKIVEQVMFTEIEYPDSISYKRFEVHANASQLSWLEPKRDLATLGLPKAVSDQIDRIGFVELPMGYEEVSETYSPMPSSSRPVSHVMLTDGMASVSVYVEYLMKSEHNLSSLGVSSMGAMNAYGISLDEALITAVGEVPIATVRAIAMAVKIRP
jgi:sigma-E factor negative regulatory protein RseB